MLYTSVPAGQEENSMGHPSESEEHQDELDNAAALQPSIPMPNPVHGARCVNGHLMRPMPADEEPPSTACRPNVVNAPGGVTLGGAPQVLVNLQAEFHLAKQPNFHPQLHLHQRRFPTRVMLTPVHPPILENGHHCTRGPRRLASGTDSFQSCFGTPPECP